MPVQLFSSYFSIPSSLKTFICLLVCFLLNYGSKSQAPGLKLFAVVNDQQVQLQWTAKPDTTTDFFVIETSLQGTEFSVLAIIQAKPPASPEAYGYKQEMVTKGVHYYRIKEVNKAGNIVYSAPVRIVIGPKKSIALFPNPTKGELNISHPMGSGNEKIHVMDMNGNIILQKEIGSSTVLTKIDLLGYTKGTYQVIWSGEQDQLIQRFVLH
jgi:hypothetical protein